MKKKNRKFKPGDILFVEWEDHFSDSSWRDADACLTDPPEIIQTVGRLVGENKRANGIVITGNFVPASGRVGLTMCILKNTITKIKKVK